MVVLAWQFIQAAPHRLMLLIKIIVTILVVTGLSIVAERVSPKAAGILSGYPLGSAISLFFIGLEQGTVYAGNSAVFTVGGMAALLSFFHVYYLVSSKPHKNMILTSSGAALAVFLATSFILHAFAPPPWAGVLIAAAAIFGFGKLFRHIPNTQITGRIRLGLRVLLFRAALTALIVLTITGAAHTVPPNWAGLFSAFPATVFPLVIIIHHSYGADRAHTIIKNLPPGLWSLVFYCLVISFAYPRLGVYWGTAIGYAAATLYLLGLAAVQRRLAQKGNADIIKVSS